MRFLALLPSLAVAAAVAEPPAASDPCRPLPLATLASNANCTVTGTSAPVGRLAPESLPPGTRTIDGIPFVFAPGPSNAVDVAASMRGLTEPFRNKATFFSARSTRQNGRCLLEAPTNQYRALHLIAFSAGRPAHAPRVTVRVGYHGDGNAIMEDAVASVPPLRGAPGGMPVKLADGGEGRLHHLVVPLDQSGNVQGLKAFNLEFTRDLRVHVPPPDPNEFGVVPAGPPSDAVILAATLEPSPVTMTHASDEPGNVFSEGQKAVFRLSLANRSTQPLRGKAFARCSGPGTAREHGIARRDWKVEADVELAPGATKVVPLDVTPGRRGWFACTLGIEVDGRAAQRRDTTFAVLAPDTRRAGAESPFGVWEFWGPHSVAPRPDQVEMLASLIRKGGWRHTYGGLPALGHAKPSDVPDEVFARMRREHKFTWNLWSLPESYQRDEGWFDEAEFAARVAPEAKRALGIVEPFFKVLHESRSSPSLIRRFSEHLGGTPYAMPPAESEKLARQMEKVRRYCLALKAVDPAVRVVLFNDYPAFVFQYLERGFPAEAFDVIGLEGAMFMRRPERQPDWLSLLGNLHEMKRALAKFGYSKPIWTTEALYHATAPGALDLHEQAVISVREAMLALHLGVQRMAAAGCVRNPADDYHWSNWGSSGFCFRDPEINPKPSYAMYAWLTQVLDQARPAGHLRVPNASLHALAFQKPDGSRVHAIWTAGGRQEVSLACPGIPEVRDAYGNLLADGANPLALVASETPIYLVGGRVESVLSARAVEVPAEAGRALLDFDRPESLSPIAGLNAVLESSWDTPRIKGGFESSFVTEDGASALRVALKPDGDPRKLLPRYVEFALKEPLRLEGRPSRFTVRVKGNSGWGRVLFELVDAKGRVWTSCGNQYEGASNSADPEGDSFVSFEGWQTMSIPVVGMVESPDQSVYWPRNFNWWPTNTPEEKEIPARQEQAKADHARALEEHKAAMARYEEALKKHAAARQAAEAAGKRPPGSPKKPVEPRPPTVRNMGLCPVDYPLTLTKVIVTMRPHILYADEEIPVGNPVILLDRLGVIHDAVPPAQHP